MNIKQIIIIFSFLTTCTTAFWGVRRSLVPQFILDTQHPWIEKYKDQLQKIDIDNLCEVDQEKHAKFREGNIPSPPNDLFAKLEVNNNRAGVNRDGWKNTLDRLHEMQRCPAALKTVEELSVDIFTWEKSMPPKNLPGLFVDVLHSMPNLKKLEWEVRDGANQAFGKVFSQRNLTLPSIKHLQLGPFSEFLLPMCPVLESIEQMGISWHSWYDKRNPYEQIIKIASNSKHLKSLSLGSAEGWNEDIVDSVFASMPNLTSLGIQSPLRSQTNPRRSYGKDTGILKNVSMALSKFEKLEHLQLPDAGSLGMGFDGGAWCGNAYFGRGGREYGRQVSKERAETTDKATKIVLKELSGLKSLEFDGERANITRTEDGEVMVKWPWTDRLQEWAEEIYPVEPGPHDEDWQGDKEEL